MIKQFATGSRALKDFLASISEKFSVIRDCKLVGGRQWKESSRFIVTYDGRFFVECWTVPGEVSLRMGPETPIEQLPHYLAVKQDLEGCHD